MTFLIPKPALHYKKLKEISDWIVNHISQPKNSILCLSGPSGTGKRTILNHLAAELNFSLVNIKFPDYLSSSISNTTLNATNNANEGIQTIESFMESILFSSGASSLQFFIPDEDNDYQLRPASNEKKRIFLIEDYFSYSDSFMLSFFSFIQNFCTKSQFAKIIIIYTELSLKDRSFFAKCSSSTCTLIKVSPIPPSYIEKVIKSSINYDAKKRKNCSNLDNLIREVSQSSNGDIRLALTTFSFWNLLPGSIEMNVNDMIDGDKRNFFGPSTSLHNILYELFFNFNDSYFGHSKTKENSIQKKPTLSTKVTDPFNKWFLFCRYCQYKPSISPFVLMSYVWENIPLFIESDYISFLCLCLEFFSDCSYDLNQGYFQVSNCT